MSKSESPSEVAASHQPACCGEDNFEHNLLSPPNSTGRPLGEQFLDKADISPQSVISSYRRYAPVYNTLFGAVLAPGRNHMADVVSSLSPDRILEVGVGTGLALPKYPSSARITGIDLSPDMLTRAQKVADANPTHSIELHEMDAEHLAFENDSFDCVTAPYVLSVTPDPDRLVSELRRVCRPNGHIVIVNHFSGSPFWWLLERMVKSVADRIGFRSDFSYERHIMSHDWHVASMKRVNLMGLSKLVVIRNV